MTDGLKDAHREAIIAVIAANDRVERAVLFGSRATGTNTVSSDVDIALFGDRLTLTDQARLDAQLEEIPMAQSVDLVLHDSVQDRALREHIRRQGVAWYERCSSLPSGTTHPRGLPPPESIYWPLVPARDLFQLTYGRALAAPARRPGNVPVYGTNGRCGSHDAALFQGPGVILGRKGQGPLGVEWSDGPYWVIDTAYTLTPLRQDINLRFAYYLLKFIGLNHLKDGTSNPTLSRETFGAQALPLPPMRSQRAIAHVLGALDDKIELNRRMNATLEAMARALFRSWFVDFAPVRAKTEGRDTGLPKDVAELFPDRLVDSELGEIPEGWNVGVLGDAVELLNGGTPRTAVARFWNGDIPWYTAKDAPAPQDVFVIETERTITQAGVDNSATTVLPPRTTIISARGTVGRLACLGRPMAMNQTCYGIRGAKGYQDFFTYWLVRTAVEELQRRTHGTIFDTITRQTFTLVHVPLPAANVADTFESAVKPLMKRILGNLHESSTIAALRDSLLSKLISGELRVTGPERASVRDSRPAPVGTSGP